MSIKDILNSLQKDPKTKKDQNVTLTVYSEDYTEYVCRALQKIGKMVMVYQIYLLDAIQILLDL